MSCLMDIFCLFVAKSTNTCLSTMNKHFGCILEFVTNTSTYGFTYTLRVKRKGEKDPLAVSLLDLTPGFGIKINKLNILNDQAYQKTSLQL